MALGFPNPSRSYDETHRRVRFWGHDGAQEVTFFIEESAIFKIAPRTTTADGLDPGGVRRRARSHHGRRRQSVLAKPAARLLRAGVGRLLISRSEPMTTRTTSKTVTFTHPFTLDGIEGFVPAGSYVVDTDEETIDSVSFIAWRRTTTLIRVPIGGAMQAYAIDPEDLEASLFADASAEAEPA